jgi:hypothetical protein
MSQEIFTIGPDDPIYPLVKRYKSGQDMFQVVSDPPNDGNNIRVEGLPDDAQFDELDYLKADAHVRSLYGAESYLRNTRNRPLSYDGKTTEERWAQIRRMMNEEDWGISKGAIPS